LFLFKIKTPPPPCPLSSLLHYLKRRCRASVFGIKTRLRSGRSGVRIRQGLEIRLLPTDPRSLYSNGNRGSFREVKRLGHDVDHSPPSSAVFMTGAVPPLPLYAFKAWIGKTSRFAFLLSQTEQSSHWFCQVHMPGWQVRLDWNSIDTCLMGT